MAKYQGGKVGSLARLREQLKKGGGGTFIKNVPANDVMVVRFLTEPDDWHSYKEAYDTEVRRYYPVTEGMDTNNPDIRISNRFLCCALDVTEDKVIPLKLTKDLANRVMMRYDRYDTIMDRDYELSRMGEGLDTTYDCAPGDKVKRNLGKYELLDLEEVLNQAADFGGGDGAPAKSTAKKAKTSRVVDDEDEDETEEEEAPAKPAAKKATKAAAKPAPKRAPKVVEPDEEEEEAEEEEEEEEEPTPPKKPAPKKATAPAKKAAPKKPAPPVEEEEEFEEDEDEAEEDEDGEEEESGDDTYSEAELQAMSLRDLRELATVYEIDHTGMNKAALIEAILYE